MNKLRGQEYAEIFRRELFENILPFWLKNSLDNINGGYFTCLSRNGKVFDTDKFVWLQGRQAWTFSMMNNREGGNEEWREHAKSGVDFLDKYGHDGELNFYFSLTKSGKPLIVPYNIFSDCFACMAFAQYAGASGEEYYADRAISIFRNILAKKNNPKGKWNKATGKRPLENFALPMILSNLSLELEEILKSSEIEESILHSKELVMGKFLDKQSNLIFENRLPDGKFHDSFDGRLLNPGHGIEAMWFMMDIGEKYNEQNLIDQSVDVTLSILDYSWDKEYGGVFYFLDALGHPPQQLEWDQKLWWVHMETLVALSKAYKHTGREDVWVWFERVFNYTWKNFRDPEYGEWYGYLNRRGEVLLNLKGGKWKGCFHVPRGLYQCMKTLRDL